MSGSPKTAYRTLWRNRIEYGKPYCVRRWAMETSMEALRRKEIVNLKDGSKLGYADDAVLDVETARVLAGGQRPGQVLRAFGPPARPADPLGGHPGHRGGHHSHQHGRLPQGSHSQTVQMAGFLEQFVKEAGFRLPFSLYFPKNFLLFWKYQKFMQFTA